MKGKSGGRFPQDPVLDQVFMVDAGILERIISVSEIRKTETVLEIGAGTGNLTKLLAKKSKKVIAIEIDERLKPVMKKELNGVNNVEVIWGNALEVLEERNLKFDKIVSNPPYSISEPLIRTLFRKEFRAAILTMPWKFVERLSANPEEPFYSKLSLFSQAFFRIETLLRVSSSAWTPKPDAESAVIRLTRKNDENKREMVLRGLSLQDDKKLKNALREIIIESEKSTKRKAKDKMGDLGLPGNLLEKKISEMSLEEIGKVLKAAG